MNKRARNFSKLPFNGLSPIVQAMLASGATAKIDIREISDEDMTVHKGKDHITGIQADCIGTHDLDQDTVVLEINGKRIATSGPEFRVACQGYLESHKFDVKAPGVSAAS